jgi:hypothetical protein
VHVNTCVHHFGQGERGSAPSGAGVREQNAGGVAMAVTRIQQRAHDEGAKKGERRGTTRRHWLRADAGVRTRVRVSARARVRACECESGQEKQGFGAVVVCTGMCAPVTNGSSVAHTET